MSTDSLQTALGDAGPAKEPDTPITSVRVLYPDLHGIARGKDVPIQQFDTVVEHGLCFCAAVMGTDLRHTPVVGGEAGYPDLIVHPDLATMVTLPWEPGVACCLSNLEPAQADTPICDPRGALARAVATVGELGFEPIVGPELEFFLVVRDPAAPNGVRRHVDNLSMVYTVGPLADPDGLVRRMTEQLAAIGLDVFAVNHEFMNSQYEINLRHSGALDAADRAFRLKAAVKDIAAQNGLHATFMGKPFNDQGGSGTHLHLSLNRDGANAFADADRRPRRQRRAAPLHRRPDRARTGADGVPEPDGQRLPPDPAGLAGADPRQLGLGQPRDLRPDPAGARRRDPGRAARRRRRRQPVPGIAAVLLAGADGIRRKLTPPPAVSGDAYRAADDVIGAPLPTSLDAGAGGARARTRSCARASARRSSRPSSR